MDDVVAIDLGGTKTLVAVTDPDGDLRVSRVATDVAGGPEAIVEQIVAAVSAERGLAPPARVVVASPGSLDTDAGIVRYAANLPLHDFPLAAALGARLGATVELVGDAAAATVSEFATGAAAGVTHGAYVTVSTGVGVALVVDGRIVTGAGRQGGELGHVPVRPHDGVLCACGQRGCLEAYASGRGVADRARDAVGAGADTRLARLAPERITARDVLDAARAGDPPATAIMAEATELLAVALAALVRVLSPHAIVLGGGLLLAGGLTDALRERVVGLLDPNAEGVGERIVAAAHGDRSALEGAVALARGDRAALYLLAPATAEPQA